MKNKKRTKIPKMEEKPEDLEDINMNEVTDSEDEYSDDERRLLNKVRTRQSSESEGSDYEVYGLRGKDDEDQDDMEEEEEADSMESDIEGLGEDFDLPNEKAWGQKKKAYYSTDYVDPDYATVNEKDLAIAEMEEEEARNIQKRLAEQLDDADFGLEFIQEKKSDDQEDSKEPEEIIKTDLSKLSKRQRQAVMQKESPEFLALVQDFKDRMTEARDVLAPFLKLVKKDVLPSCPSVSFVKTKYYLLLNYCINICFYLMLKAKRLPINSHPVIKRLAQYRQLLNQLESGQGNLIQEIQEILTAEKQGKPLYNVSDGTQVSANKKKATKCITGKLNRLRKFTKEEVVNTYLSEFEPTSEIENKGLTDDEGDSDDMSMDNDMSMNKEEETENNDMTESVISSEGKRAITYEMAKNKGLTPHRKKDQRNPRVKHRNKYRKAKIRRKGAVREVRKEVTRYAGEISGIKASVKKSIKLK